jgi:hypothetical protein
VSFEDPEEVRQLMVRYVLLLSAAEGITVGMLESLQQLQQGIRPDHGHDRVAHVAETLGMIQAWSREAESLWKTLGIERRKGPSATSDSFKDQRKPRGSRSISI